MSQLNRAAWKRLFLGVEPAQQARASAALLVLLGYLAFTGLRELDVALGMVDARSSLPLTVWELGVGMLFYAVIRSGLNLRLARDRSLGAAQSLCAMTSICWAYAITGPSRGALILIMVSTISFGMFAMPPQRARGLAITGTVMLLAVMVWKACTSPATHAPRVEAMHFLCSVLVLSMAGHLTVRIGKLRLHLQQQRTELTAALARIQALASHDELTGLVNRRAVLESMRRELAARQRPQPVLLLALIDIDHFKRVNDQYGHAAGDVVLRRFAERARTTVRTGDTLARWGGEEFLLVLPATDVASAVIALNRVRERLAAESFDDLAVGLRITCSAGLAECAHQADLEAAIERADSAMYRAKSAGRDRVFGPAEMAAGALTSSPAGGALPVVATPTSASLATAPGAETLAA